MSGTKEHSGGRRKGAGRPPLIRLKNNQVVEVQVTLAGPWVEATVSRSRKTPEETVLLLSDDTIRHIVIRTVKPKRSKRK